MYQNLEIKNRIARKEHRCSWCGNPIRNGEEYEWQKFIFDGAFYEWHAHLACSRVANAIWDYADPDDGMDEDLFMDTCSEVCHNFICPDCPNWNKEYEECETDEGYCIDKMDAFFQTHELYIDRRKGRYQIWKCRQKETDGC